MQLQAVLVAGQWREAQAVDHFRAVNPQTGQPCGPDYPVSSWHDCHQALDAACEAFARLRRTPGERIARFLERYAERIEARAEEIVQAAHEETALPLRPRLAEVELPRTTGQLRQAAQAARDGSWCRATIDTRLNIRSVLAPLGPVCVMGPNNFPLAFGSASGGDFAAAIAAGCPVIAKAHSSHPTTTRLFAEEAFRAVQETELPAATVQLLYRLRHEDGLRLVADPRIGATGYTGSRASGLKLKAAADAAGKPIYLELSSINPVVLLPAALRQRIDAVVEEFAGSCLLGCGQFCTNPGLVLLLQGEETEQFIRKAVEHFERTPPGTLLSAGVLHNLKASVQQLQEAGAELLTGGRELPGPGFRFANTLLRVSAARFLEDPCRLQTEAFGNSSLLVVAADPAQLCRVIDHLEGNLTGTIYAGSGGEEEALFEQVAFHLRPRVGRLLCDKMPTGVAVTAAMNHGGPYPATGHPHFTAVGLPPAIWRFTMLQCYDNVPQHRLPEILRDPNPTGSTWRWVDGRWTQEDVPGSPAPA